MPTSDVQKTVEEWVKVIPKALIEQFSQQAKIEALSEEIETTLNPALEQAGFKAEIKLLSNNFNKIVRLKVENTYEMDSSENEDGMDLEEDPLYFCLCFEDKSKFVQPDISDQLANYRKEDKITAHMATAYASNQTDEHRVSLLPFYQGGTLEDKVSYATYFQPASDTANDKDNYDQLCALKAVQNQYFSRHNDIRFTSEGMQNANHFRVFSYESVNAAIQLYELAEKNAQLQNAQNTKSTSRLDRLKATISRSRTKKEEIEPDNQNEKKHIDNFFKFLIYSVEGSIPPGPKQATLVNKLQEQFPDKQQGENYIERVRIAMEQCNNILSDEINELQFDANLTEVIEAQQKQLLDMSIEVAELFTALEESDIQYFDLKATNFFVVDGKLVISDNKSLTQRGDDTVLFGTGHMTYKTPDKEFSQESLNESVDKEWAKNLTKYQMGVMLYDMTIGITGQHIFSSTDQLLDAGLVKELNFDHQCFETETGKVMQTIIQSLTQIDPTQRPDISNIRDALVEYKQGSDNLMVMEEELKVELPPPPPMLVCPPISPPVPSVSLKEKAELQRSSTKEFDKEKDFIEPSGPGLN